MTCFCQYTFISIDKTYCSILFIIYKKMNLSIIKKN